MQVVGILPHERLRDCLSKNVNMMIANDLVMQSARISAAMALT